MGGMPVGHPFQASKSLPGAVTDTPQRVRFWVVGTADAAPAPPSQARPLSGCPTPALQVLCVSGQHHRHQQFVTHWGTTARPSPSLLPTCVPPVDRPRFSHLLTATVALAANRCPVQLRRGLPPPSRSPLRHRHPSWTPDTSPRPAPLAPPGPGSMHSSTSEKAQN